jgi:hypothetical protein
MLSARPLITQLVVTAVHVCPPLEVAVYPVIGEPPVLAGGVQVIVAEVLSIAVAVTPVGASGATKATTMAGSSQIEI